MKHWEIASILQWRLFRIRCGASFERFSLRMCAGARIRHFVVYICFFFWRPFHLRKFHVRVSAKIYFRMKAQRTELGDPTTLQNIYVPVVCVWRCFLFPGARVWDSVFSPDTCKLGIAACVASKSMISDAKCTASVCLVAYSDRFCSCYRRFCRCFCRWAHCGTLQNRQENSRWKVRKPK